jgi:hypothetical protein
MISASRSTIPFHFATISEGTCRDGAVGPLLTAVPVRP